MHKSFKLSQKIIQQLYEQSPQLQKLRTAISNFEHTKGTINIKGLIGSSLSFVLTDAFKTAKQPFLLIFNDKEEAAYHLNDLEQMIGEKDVLFYPGSYRRPYQIEETDNANVLLRAEVLNRINSRKKPAVIVTYPDALFEKVVTRRELDKNTLKIKIEDSLSLDFLNEVLFEYKFKRVDFVTEPGEFSVRGGIVDVFSFSNDEPYRLEFFGDEVESIRTFDVETQLSLEKLNKITIIPNVENKFLDESRESFLQYIASNTLIFNSDIDILLDRLDSFFEKATEAFSKLSTEIKHAEPKALFVDSTLFKNELEAFSLIIGGNPSQKSIQEEIQFNTRPQPSFNKKFDLLIESLNEQEKAGFTNYIFCSTEQQAQRFHDIFDEVGKKVHYKTVVYSLFQGFIDVDLKITCFTDHQIFERYHKFHVKNGYSKKQAITLKELTRLDIGDYVTHMDHGVENLEAYKK